MAAKKTPRAGLQTGRGAHQKIALTYNSLLADNRQSIGMTSATSSQPAVEAIGGRYGK